MKKIIEHAVRNISFSVDELKPWTPEDENLITAYTSLHDAEIKLKAEGSALLTLAGNLNKQTEKVRNKLMALKERIAALSKLADRFVMVDPNRQSWAEELNKQTEKVGKHIGAYHDMLTVADSAVAACEEKNSPFIKEVEDIERWEKFDDIKNGYFNDYETKAIDIISFGNDEDMFRMLASSFTHQNKGIIDAANNAIDNYNRLLLETEMQYALWEEFLKRLSVIRMITESEAGEIFTSAN